MAKPQRGRKHRTPQKRSPRRHAEPVPRAGRAPTSALPLRAAVGLAGTLLAQAPPDQLVELVLPHLWAAIVDGIPANVCVDACLTLKYAYGQFGIRSVLRPVDLTVRNSAGKIIVHGTPAPSWNAEGTVFDGHCVLLLPDSRRFVDPTIEQYPQIRDLGMGPLIGRAVAASSLLDHGDLMPAGAHHAIQRRELTLLYTVAPEQFAHIIESQPRIASHAGSYYRAGVNLASAMLLALRTPEVIGRARQAPYPRLRALLRALCDAPDEIDESHDYRFQLTAADGTPQSLRLDEVPLPPTTPSAYPPSEPA